MQTPLEPGTNLHQNQTQTPSEPGGILHQDQLGTHYQNQVQTQSEPERKLYQNHFRNSSEPGENLHENRTQTPPEPRGNLHQNKLGTLHQNQEKISIRTRYKPVSEPGPNWTKLAEEHICLFRQFPVCFCVSSAYFLLVHSFSEFSAIFI
ncbi:hypothetical protein AMECASPLE_016662 [Ameca splendens]|uniref:Uncharacterized protein n=1 Tax=Ameca splendens TaxID=208324 RepID=A0ABV0XR90_9TELE